MPERFNFTLGQPQKDQAALLAAIERFGVASGLSEACRYRLGLIVDELVANCLMHGACCGDNQTIEVVIQNRENELIVEIADSGPPFDPTTHPLPQLAPAQPTPIGGVGLCLVRRLTGRMEYIRQDGRNRLLLSIDKAKQENACSYNK